MQRMMTNLRIYRRLSMWFRLAMALCMPVGVCLILFAACLMTTGCAGLPQWLADANQFLPAAAASLGSILTAIGVLSGNPALTAAAALMATIAGEIEKGIQDLQAMVAEYESKPNGTLLQNIENGTQSVLDNLGKLLGDFGLPENLSTPFIALAQLILTQFEAWAQVIPTLKLAYQDHDAQGIKDAVAKMTSLPLTSTEFKHAFNTIVTANPQLGATTIA